jgi:hypothetical protein
MTEAIAARTRGDDYQARVFWLNACRLFQEHSAVEEVAFDDPELRYFDDVSLYYKWAVPDERGDTVLADHYQVKFHVDCAGCLTWESLMDPAFIGAKATSLLQRMQEFRTAYVSTKIPFRLYFVSPWDTDSVDPLAKLVSNQGGEIRFSVLFDGGSDRSLMGKVRKSWREHLNVSEEELRETLRPLRVVPRYFDMKTLSDLLAIRLHAVGLAPVEDHSRANVYDDLIKKVHQAGRARFTRDELQRICEEERLWRSSNSENSAVETFGIRSFMRWAEHMEDETNRMLCLVRHFDNRQILSPSLWADKIVPEVKQFLTELTPGRSYRLLLDTHTSIGFLAGYFLPAKSGIEVAVMQGTLGKRQLWLPRSQSQETSPWLIGQEALGSSGSEVAVAVSVTHDVLPDVRAYVKAHLPNVGRVLTFSLKSGPSPTAVRDADHALALTQGLSVALRTERTHDERENTSHLFLAAPVGFSFLLGRFAQGFGPVVVYEYDFESNAPGAYQPGVRVPVNFS